MTRDDIAYYQHHIDTMTATRIQEQIHFWQEKIDAYNEGLVDPPNEGERAYYIGQKELAVNEIHRLEKELSKLLV